MQCLTGAAGANNIPPDFCERQLNKQRSVNWAVLPDKASPIDGSVRPFAVIITIRGTKKCRRVFEKLDFIHDIRRQPLVI